MEIIDKTWKKFFECLIEKLVKYFMGLLSLILAFCQQKRQSNFCSGKMIYFQIKGFFSLNNFFLILCFEFQESNFRNWVLMSILIKRRFVDRNAKNDVIFFSWQIVFNLETLLSHVWSELKVNIRTQKKTLL